MTVTSEVNSDQQIPTGLSASGIELTERLLEIVVAQDPMPGDRLPSERRLSELLGVGRHVVRDSLKVLHLLGFVEVRQGQGTFWRNNSTSSLPRSIEWRLIAQSGSTEDLVEARSEVEVLVCGLAAARGTDERLAEIRQYYEFMRLAAATDNVELYSRSDISFHLAIAKAARNTVLETMLTSIRTLIATWTDRVLEDIRLEESFAVHEPIMAALDSGDADAARAAMRQHMDAATANLLRIAGDIS